MKKNFYITTLILCIVVFSFPCKSNSELEESKEGQLIFKAEAKDLWFTRPGLKDNTKTTIEITLPGKFFRPPKEVKIISKKEADRSSLEGLVTSYISATKALDPNWISENFKEEEQEKIKDIFKNKDFIKSTKDKNKDTKSVQITGQALYKGHVIVFIEQEFEDKKVTEAIACQKIGKEWKITNALSSDRTFDIVFAALSSGKVFENKSMKDIIGKPDIKFIH